MCNLINTHTLMIDVQRSRKVVVSILSCGNDPVHYQDTHFIPIVGVGKRGEYESVHGDLPRQYSFGTTLRFTGPVPANSRQ